MEAGQGSPEGRNMVLQKPLRNFYVCVCPYFWEGKIRNIQINDGVECSDVQLGMLICMSRRGILLLVGCKTTACQAWHRHVSRESDFCPGPSVDIIYTGVLSNMVQWYAKHEKPQTFKLNISFAWTYVRAMVDPSGRLNGCDPKWWFAF